MQTNILIDVVLSVFSHVYIRNQKNDRYSHNLFTTQGWNFILGLQLLHKI